MTEPGTIVVLNGVPRSGKSSISAAIQDSFEGVWMNLGVDVFARYVTPSRFRPGIGLRPGGERPDLEMHIPVMYDALYDSVMAHSRLGLNVVVDVGHHDGYSNPQGILTRVAQRLAELPAYFVGVRCPVEMIMVRRDTDHPGRGSQYATSEPDGGIPDAVLRWEREVHIPGIYDLEVDTSALSPVGCAAAIQGRLDGGPSTAFWEIARLPL